MQRLALFIAIFVVAVGCASRRSILTSDVVYDNRGGFAYGGLLVFFRASGDYEIQRYTDVMGEDTTIEHGTYQRQESAYVLNHAGAWSVYRIVNIQGVEYLLDSREFDDYRRTRDPETLRTAMRRAVNHALQRTPPSRSGGNPRVPRDVSLNMSH